MNNLKNKKFLQYKKENRDSIKLNLRKDIIDDFVYRGYTSICKDDTEYTISQMDFSFYSTNELENIESNKLIKILSTPEGINDIYAEEGTLYDDNEDIIDISLNNLLDTLVDLILDKDFTSPSHRSICKVYGYFLNDFFKPSKVFL